MPSRCGTSINLKNNNHKKEEYDRKKNEKPRLATIIGLVAVVSAILAVAVVALLVNIFEHKQEAKNPFFRVVELNDSIDDPSIWGKNFPHQYDGYSRTVDQVRTKYGGSEAMPRTPTAVDPRSVVAQ
ncbi:MAG: hypothetical protein ACPMAG_15265, partial [Limisphaerales bacterium]